MGATDRMRLSSALIVAVLAASFGSMSQAALGAQHGLPSGKTYKMRGPKTGATFVVRGSRIIFAHVWAFEECENGSTGFSGLADSARPGILIDRHGEFSLNEGPGDWGPREEDVLEGTVYRRTIVGSYFAHDEVEVEAEGGEYLESCGTGEPIGDIMWFAARRVSR